MKYYIETYGCQMNVADSELVSSILSQSGYLPVDNINNAEVIIFNTCSVRQHAEDRVLGRIANELKRKNQNPNIKIGIIGCMAQRIGDELVHNNNGVDFVAGVDQYDKLPDLISSESKNDFLEFNDEQMYNYIQPIHKTGVCGFVTIMRGCNNYCSYCIVPYLRGNERSRSFNLIAEDIDYASVKGIKDITLLGQNVNSYKYNHMNFSDLLIKLNELKNIYRLRFITSHPKDLSDQLIQVIASADKVCEHIHLPLQSGDNEILAIMNRKYTIEHYITLINKLRNAVPNISITTDIIAGFPGETERHFKNTVTALNEIGFDYAFCFKYSNREGTLAADYENQVEEEIRLLRLQKLIEIQRKQTKLKFEEQVGKIVEVLVEGQSKHGGKQLSGKTRDFKICVFDGDENQIGCLTKVRVVNATAGTLIGRQRDE